MSKVKVKVRVAIGNANQGAYACKVWKSYRQNYVLNEEKCKFAFDLETGNV